MTDDVEELPDEAVVPDETEPLSDDAPVKTDAVNDE